MLDNNDLFTLGNWKNLSKEGKESLSMPTGPITFPLKNFLDKKVAELEREEYGYLQLEWISVNWFFSNIMTSIGGFIHASSQNRHDGHLPSNDSPTLEKPNGKSCGKSDNHLLCNLDFSKMEESLRKRNPTHSTSKKTTSTGKKE